MWHDATFWFWMAGAWILGAAMAPLIIVFIANRLRNRIARKARESLVRDGIITANEARERAQGG
jgi:hypothetical protein